MVKKHILSKTHKQNTHDLVLTVLLLLFTATAAHAQEKIADGDTQKVSPSFVLNLVKSISGLNFFHFIFVKDFFSRISNLLKSPVEYWPGKIPKFKGSAK